MLRGVIVCRLTTWGSVASVVLICACSAKPSPQTSVSQPPHAHQTATPSAPQQPGVASFVLPLAIENDTVCVIESGRGICRIGREPDFTFPFEDVRAMGAGLSTVCALHGDRVDCRRFIEPSAADFGFAAPGAREVKLAYDVVCVDNEAHELRCRRFDWETGALIEGSETLVAEHVADFKVEQGSVLWVDDDGLVWRTHFEFSDDSVSAQVSDPQGLQFPRATRVASSLRTVIVTTTDGEVWSWTGPKRRVDDIEPAVKIEGVTGATDVASNSGTYCAATDSGVWCWGENMMGDIGPTAPLLNAPPTKLPIPGEVHAIEASWGFWCAGTADAPAHCWGSTKFAKEGQRVTFGERIIETGSVSIDVASPGVCSTNAAGERRCYGQDPDFAQNPFTMGRGWEPSFETAVRRSSSCALVESGELQCFRRRRRRPQVVATNVVAFSAAGQQGCFVDEEGAVGCFTKDAPTFSLTGVHDAVDVVRRSDGACVLTRNGRIGCFEIPASPSLKSVTTNNVETKTWRPRVRRVRGASSATQIEHSPGLLCAFDASANTVDCWKRGEESKAPIRVPIEAKSLRMVQIGGCGLRTDDRPYCFSEKRPQKLVALPELFDRPLAQFELAAGSIFSIPICARDFEGAVDCIGLEQQRTHLLWPPFALTPPLD